MRAPRYRFPDEVRSTARTMASHMVEQGSVVSTPEELDGWLAGQSSARESLERGGFGTEFDSHDLYPLLEVYIVKAGGRVVRVEEPQRRGRAGTVLALTVGVVVVVAVSLFLLIGA